jgi:predicted Zn-dependent protease with MMP-like domain
MIEVSREEFEAMVQRAIRRLPKRYIDNLKNVAFIVEDEPDQAQRKKLSLRNDQSLFGLYEGVPLSQRQGTVKILPDKITIFQKVIQQHSFDMASLYDRTARTIWHEVAHYYGLDHARIYELEDQERKRKQS